MDTLKQTRATKIQRRSMGFAGTAPPILGSCMLRLLGATNSSGTEIGQMYIVQVLILYCEVHLEDQVVCLWYESN